jgi:NADH:ubiquinone oxidoreductase subunit 6 (subunit J)
MNFLEIIFYSFSAILVLSALGVITSRNPVHSALLLVLAFFYTGVSVCGSSNGVIPVCSDDVGY